MSKKNSSSILPAVISSAIVAALIGFLAGGAAWQLSQQYQLTPPNSPTDNSAQQPVVLPPSQTAQAYEEQIIRVVEKTSPAVVSIVITKDLPIIEQQFIDPFGDFFKQDPFFDDFFGRFRLRVPKLEQKGTERREIGGGSGFIIRDDGLIITNRHVVEDTEASYTVITNDGKKYDAKVLARHPLYDVSVIKIEAQNLPTLKLGDSDNLKIGQTVIAIGNALGELNNTVSVGVISGLRRSVTAQGSSLGPEQLENVIQTDAAINRGNSGGPLLNLSGEVIGINTAVAVGAQNIGFALPVHLVKDDIEEVERTNKLTYAFLGVRHVIINKALQQLNDLPVDYGALIISGQGSNDPAVTPESPADKAGLKEGDIILEVDGQRVTQKNSLSKLIKEREPGDTITLKVLRGEEELTLTATLTERSS